MRPPERYPRKDQNKPFLRLYKSWADKYLIGISKGAGRDLKTAHRDGVSGVLEDSPPDSPKIAVFREFELLT